MSFEFERRPARGALACWVEAVWFARGQIAYRRETIAPTRATVAVLNLGDPIVHATLGPRATRLRATDGWLTGPHDHPALNEPTGRTLGLSMPRRPRACRCCWRAWGRSCPRRPRASSAWPVPSPGSKRPRNWGSRTSRAASA